MAQGQDCGNPPNATNIHQFRSGRRRYRTTKCQHEMAQGHSCGDTPNVQIYLHLGQEAGDIEWQNASMRWHKDKVVATCQMLQTYLNSDQEALSIDKMPAWDGTVTQLWWHAKCYKHTLIQIRKPEMIKRQNASMRWHNDKILETCQRLQTYLDSDQEAADITNHWQTTTTQPGMSVIWPTPSLGL